MLCAVSSGPILADLALARLFWLIWRWLDWSVSVFFVAVFLSLADLWRWLDWSVSVFFVAVLLVLAHVAVARRSVSVLFVAVLLVLAHVAVARLVCVCALSACLAAGGATNHRFSAPLGPIHRLNLLAWGLFPFLIRTLPTLLLAVSFVLERETAALGRMGQLAVGVVACCLVSLALVAADMANTTEAVASDTRF
eukprot:g71646.t1